MLRFQGFFENDAPNASLPKNAPASLRALVTLVRETGLELFEDKQFQAGETVMSPTS